VEAHTQLALAAPVKVKTLAQLKARDGFEITNSALFVAASNAMFILAPSSENVALESTGTSGAMRKLRTVGVAVNPV
jgi:hypothetical protein